MCCASCRTAWRRTGRRPRASGHTVALRILHIAPYGPEAWAYGGIPRVVGAMVDGLRSRGHHVTLCTTDALDARSRLPRQGGSDHADRRVFRNLSNRAAYHLQAFAPVGLRRFLDAEVATFDVAHIHACHNILGIMAARALTRAQVPYVLSPNGTAPIFERRQAAKRLLAHAGGADVMAGAARVLAVSNAEDRQLHRLGLAPGVVARVPNPVDLREFDGRPDGSRFRRAHGLDDRPLVLFLGKITPRKQVGALVEAFARLPLSNAHLVIAGNDMGGLSEALRRAAERGVRDRVRLTGLLPGAARLDALAAADVVVYPSSGEVFGLVACEALLAGTPVIVGNDSGAAEVVAATGGGLAVAPGDAVALAQAIGAVLDGREAWRREADAAGWRVRALYGADTVVTALESVYDSVLGRALQASA